MLSLYWEFSKVLGLCLCQLYFDGGGYQNFNPLLNLTIAKSVCIGKKEMEAGRERKREGERREGEN